MNQNTITTITDKISNVFTNQSMNWVTSAADVSKKFCLQHKQMVISALALGVFFLWTKKSPKNSQNYQQDFSRSEINTSRRQITQVRSFTTQQNNQSRTFSKLSQNPTTLNTKNRIETLNMQRLLESDQDQQQDSHDKLFFEVYQNYLKS